MNTRDSDVRPITEAEIRRVFGYVKKTLVRSFLRGKPLQAEIESAIHEGVARAFRFYDPAHGATFEAFAMACARTETVNAYRAWDFLPRNRRKKLKAEGAEPTVIPIESLAIVDAYTCDPLEAFERAERMVTVVSALHVLSPEERDLLSRMYYDGESLTEASSAIGWSKSYACRVHQAALARLRVHAEFGGMCSNTSVRRGAILRKLENRRRTRGIDPSISQR